MFAIPTNVGISQRVVATLVACATVLFSIGAYQVAQAANLVSVSDTLSDSDISATSAHTIAFTIPTGSSLSAGQTVTLTIPASFTNVATVVSGDLTVTANSVPQTIGGFAATATTISFNGVTAAANQEVVVAIADGNITNPNAAGSYEIQISTPTDTGKTRVAILDNVLVTAIVNTVFTFVVSGLATSTTINADTTTGTTNATQIPFGTLAADTPEVLAQQLNVTTNAINGFVVTVEQDSDLASANGAVIDSFTNGAYVNTPTAWAVPSDNITLDNTWGHWGLTSNDDLNTNEFGSNGYVAASTTPRAIFSHDGPADGTTLDAGQATVGYKIEITPLQEAADDYNTTLTYIATPTF